MKTIVVKNNSFETIGFQVKQGENVIFHWGTSPNQYVFVKEVNTYEWTKEIFELVSLRAQINERCNFVSNFVDVLKKSNIVLSDDQVVNMRSYKDETARLEVKFENIVKNII